MLSDKFIRSVGILCGLLLGGTFFRKTLVYTLIVLIPMWFRVQPLSALAKNDLASGTVTALTVLLVVTNSLMSGLMGATLGFIAKKLITAFTGKVDWIEDLSKRGINRV